MINDINSHPYAQIFPKMSASEFDELKRDIEVNGLRQPIVTYEGLILDGRHRHAACSDLNIDCEHLEFDGNDAAALAFVISTNLHRRHIDESQRAWIASKLATLAQGQKKANTAIAVSQEDAARILNVSTDSIQRAKVVRDQGVSELHDAVEQGRIKVSVAAKVAKLPDNMQRQVIEAERPDQAVKKVVREEKERNLAELTISKSLAQGNTLYNVIYADPPWRFATYSELGMDRSAENHYPTMPIEDIKRLNVPSASDAVLFLWATPPMLPEAIEVMQSWGFAYKSHIIWVKDRVGTGYWFRSQHELLLVGTRGNIPAPAPGSQKASILEAPLARHSEKPAAFAEMIEALFPNLPKVELFCRSPRLGWDAHGNEAAA